MGQLAKFTSDTKSGRLAILARETENDPWTQVESVLGANVAADYVQELEYYDSVRAEAIEDMKGEDWGDDAPRAQA